MKQKNNVRFVLCFILLFVLFFLCCAERWFHNTFSAGIEQIIFTVNAPMNGAGLGFFQTFLTKRNCALLLCFIFCGAAAGFLFNRVFLFVRVSFGKKQFVFNLKKCLFVFFSIFLTVFFLVPFWRDLRIKEYLASKNNTTNIYEEQYVAPEIENITGGGKNIIVIYVESLETAFSSVSGNSPNENLIPNLTRLAHENISFSNSTDETVLGGFHSPSGTGWTMAALFASQSGIPFRFPIGGNSLNMYENVGEKVVTFGDILSANGYTNEFLCGSDGNFAGRKQFFEQNGNYSVFDLFTARERGYIPDDYFVWWGFEDEVLYRIAKDEISKLAAEKEPFNFTMLTVDTHFVGGYVCSRCRRDHSVQLGDVLNCADIQLAEFIEWIKAQDFFENTAVVICGDHPSMGSEFVEGKDSSERTVYNCFINTDVPDGFAEKPRECTTFDLFPSMLSAAGFKIEGNKLALGANLFSDEKTLSEELGFETLNQEVGKRSEFYEANFY